MAEGFSRRRAKVLAVIGASVILGGCDTTQGLELPVVSEVAGSIEIAGEMYSAAEHAISPDGKHILAAVRDGEGTHLVLVTGMKSVFRSTSVWSDLGAATVSRIPATCGPLCRETSFQCRNSRLVSDRGIGQNTVRWRWSNWPAIQEPSNWSMQRIFILADLFRRI